MNPPERRRVAILGAGPTGMSVAFHLGEHSLLLERRNSLERSHDYSHDLEVGAAHGDSVGSENPGADGDRPAAGSTGKTVFISCSSNSLIHVERWRLPELSQPRPVESLGSPPSVRTLRPLLRGELRLGVQVVRVVPAAHLIELADGHRIVFDKLVSTLSLSSTHGLVMYDLPGHVRRDESLRCWLGERDIEVVDRTVREYYGDLDEFAAGKRVAAQIGEAMAEKFGKATQSKVRGVRLFEPRLVSPAS
ncbi:MAG TPA: hypothetical protein VIV63_12125 [Steroidobacteraceae bacterium]